MVNEKTRQGKSMQLWYVWALLSAFFAAITAVFAKIAVHDIDSDLATLVRTVMISAILATALAVSGKFSSFPTIPAKTWGALTASAIATGASWLCYFRALQIGDASRVAPIDKLSVVFVAILATLLLHEKLPVLGWFGILLIVTGAICVAIA